jgi:hypothetical protein
MATKIMNGATEFVIMQLLPPFIVESRFLAARHIKE